MTLQGWLQVGLTLLIGCLISIPVGRYLARVVTDRATVLDRLSNLGPASKALRDRLLDDRASLEHAQPELASQSLPSDMLTASASGLDPDISPANAALQASRVARARGIPAADVKALVAQHVTGRALGIFGEPRVNVLDLNLALQRAYPRP